MNDKTLEILYGRRVIAVLFLEDLNACLPVAESLLEGGVDIIELTLRTPIAFDAAKMVVERFPEMTVGLGTVIKTDQVKKAKDIGVDFAVSPGCNPKIMEAARNVDLPFAPGVATPTDVELAVENGAKVLKFFPAEMMGGLKYLDSMAAPFMHLNLSFIPLGGVTMDNAETYLRSPKICAIGGSWLAKPQLINSKDWKVIQNNAREIRTIVHKITS